MLGLRHLTKPVPLSAASGIEAGKQTKARVSAVPCVPNPDLSSSSWFPRFLSLNPLFRDLRTRFGSEFRRRWARGFSHFLTACSVCIGFLRMFGTTEYGGRRVVPTSESKTVQLGRSGVPRLLWDVVFGDCYMGAGSQGRVWCQVFVCFLLFSFSFLRMPLLCTFSASGCFHFGGSGVLHIIIHARQTSVFLFFPLPGLLHFRNAQHSYLLLCIAVFFYVFFAFSTKNPFSKLLYSLAHSRTAEIGVIGHFFLFAEPGERIRHRCSGPFLVCCGSFHASPCSSTLLQSFIIINLV